MKLLPRLTGFLKNASATAVLSVLVAILAWFVVINTDPDQERVVTIKNIPVATSNSTLSTLGLSVIEGGDPKVSVQVRGRVIEVGNLSEEDVQVSASFADVTGAGSYDLRLTATTSAGTVESISPATVSMTFDREVEMELPVQVDVSGLSVPENDYILGTLTATPSSVLVRGPEKELNRITRAVVHADLEESLTRSQVISSQIVLLDDEETVISGGHIITDFSEADITIPVKRKVELPLRLSFINVPDGFPLEELGYSMSNETIMVAAQERSISRTTEITAGVIDFEQLDLTVQSAYTFQVRLPEDFVNLENIENIVVEFDTQGISSTHLNLSEFYVVNTPGEFTVTPMTYGLYNVKVIGDEEILKAIKSGDFMVTIDLSDREVEQGQYEVPVSISAPTKGKVWALGNHTAVVNIQ